VPELVRPGQEALLVFPNSPGHLAIAITQLLSDKALRDRLSKAARERATTVFDANRCLDILVRELVAARPR
jgi:glycosyltransferase involved in cell wall biosynthesis